MVDKVKTKYTEADIGYDQAQPYREARRKGLAWTLIGTANTLEAIADNNLRSIDKEDDDYNSFTAKEVQVLLKVRRVMYWQVKALRAVAKHCMGIEDWKRYGH